MDDYAEPLCMIIRRKSARIEWKSARGDSVGNTRVLGILHKQLRINPLALYAFGRLLLLSLSHTPLHPGETFVTPRRSIHHTLMSH